MKKSIILILSVFLMYSCNSNSKEKILTGKWNDIIKLSTRNVEFSANEDSLTITTKGDWWWINGVSIGDILYNTHNMPDINLESNSYVIKGDGFVVERRNKNTLFVKLSKNNTGEERLMKIMLEAGDYFDGVSIKQAAN
jgi:hypothetical protein